MRVEANGEAAAAYSSGASMTFGDVTVHYPAVGAIATDADSHVRETLLVVETSILKVGLVNISVGFYGIVSEHATSVLQPCC